MTFDPRIGVPQKLLGGGGGGATNTGSLTWPAHPGRPTVPAPHPQEPTTSLPLPPPPRVDLTPAPGLGLSWLQTLQATKNCSWGRLVFLGYFVNSQCNPPCESWRFFSAISHLGNSNLVLHCSRLDNPTSYSVLPDPPF